MGLFVERLLQFLLPPICPCCDDFLAEGESGICPKCLSEIRWIEPPFCSVCGTPFLSANLPNHPCGVCLTQKKYFSLARAVGVYEGPLQEAIHRWKYEGKATLTPFFGAWMAEAFSRHWAPGEIDLFVPVPLHLHRLRERGFNQALLLAEELSRRTGIGHLKRALRKRERTSPQVHLRGAEREKGVKGSFSVAREGDVEGKNIVLLDDVYTTGATVNECSKVLLAAGALRVDVLTLAHTMRKI